MAKFQRTAALGALAFTLSAASAASPQDGAPDLPSVGVPASQWREPTLCTADENVAWSCKRGRKIISVCASRQISATEGYIQYRIGKPGALEMRFPETRVHPRGLFRYTLYIQGDQSLDFSRGGHDYSVFEDLRSDEDGVIVTKDGAQVAQLTCNSGGEGIQIVRPDLLGMAETPYGN